MLIAVYSYFKWCFVLFRFSVSFAFVAASITTGKHAHHHQRALWTVWIANGSKPFRERNRKVSCGVVPIYETDEIVMEEIESFVIIDIRWLHACTLVHTRRHTQHTNACARNSHEHMYECCFYARHFYINTHTHSSYPRKNTRTHTSSWTHSLTDWHTSTWSNLHRHEKVLGK